MIDLDVLDKQCPKCCGLGRTENPTWLRFWAMHSGLKDSFRTLETREQITNVEKMAPDQPTESMFFVCRECHGKGKILASEGKRLMEFVRFWINPNY